MDYYLINIMCNVCLLFIIRQFIGDFFQFEQENRIKRMIFSCCWFIGTLFFNEWLHIPVLNLAVNILLMLLISSVYEGVILKKILVCLMIAVISAACDMLAYVITISFLRDADYFYSFVFTVVLLTIFERILGVTIRKEKNLYIVEKEMFTLLGFPILAAVILYCVTAMDAGIYRLIACIGVVGISLLSVNLYNSLAINLTDKMRKEYLEREVEAYRHEIDIMRIANRKEENLRHDLRHHLFEIEGLAKQGKNEMVCEYVTQLRKTFTDSKQMVHTGEYETDSLINCMIDNAKRHQINVNCDIKIPEDIDVLNCKLNVIVGNLLENAIEAASKSEEKRIVFIMQYSTGILFFQIKNTYIGKIRIENGNICGRRNLNSHGIGLRSVQDIIKEQNGSLNIEITDEFFIAEGMLPLT